MELPELWRGDVGFSRDLADWTTRFIRFAERRKYGKDLGRTSPAHWNHTWIVTGSDGSIVQAMPSGVERGNVSQYVGNPTQEITVLRPHVSIQTAENAARFMEAMVGTKYGYGMIFSDALSLVFNATLRIGFANHHTCSGAAARAYTLAGVDMGDFEEWNSPADNFHVLLPLSSVIL